ncbi:MAG: hypothetical protein ACR2O6_11925 [Ilumatobacteraceae bacterium]
MSIHESHPAFTNYRVTTDDQPIAGREAKTTAAPAGRFQTPKRGRGPRWAWIGIAGGAVLVVGAGVLVFDALSEPSPPSEVEYTTSQRLVQESIDESLAERSVVESQSTGPATQFELPNGQVLDRHPGLDATEFTTSQRLIQESIDESLAANRTYAVPSTADGAEQRAEVASYAVPSTADGAEQRAEPATQPSSYELVRESINEALARNAVQAAAGTGAVVRAGMPDGHWQPVDTDANVVLECNYSGPC